MYNELIEQIELCEIKKLKKLMPCDYRISWSIAT